MATGGKEQAERRRIERQIRASGFEVEPGEVDRRLREAQARREARARLGEARLPAPRPAGRIAREQRARILGIRIKDARDIEKGNRSTYVRSVWAYAFKDDPKHPKRFRDVVHDRTFQYWYRILREQEDRLLAGKPVSRDPRGLYALALLKLGYRTDAISSYWVGMSPKGGE